MIGHILIPNSIIEPHEKDALMEIFPGRVSVTVGEIPPGSLVFTRYRSIPFGVELEAEVKLHGSQLVNSYRDHRMIANLFNWIPLLEGMTAPAYRLEDYPNLPEGEYFIKGETNSKKNDWFNSCYAPDKGALMNSIRIFQKDYYVGHQEIVIRPYRNYRTVGCQVDGRPFFNERRVFIYDGRVVSDAFYWSSFSVDNGIPEILDRGRYLEFRDAAVERTRDLARFYVIDFAEFPDGSWEVVELNDGNMSGLSDNDPYELWGNVRALLEE